MVLLVLDERREAEVVFQDIHKGPTAFITEGTQIADVEFLEGGILFHGFDFGIQIRFQFTEKWHSSIPFNL